MGSSVPKKVLLNLVLTMTENFSKQREKASQSVRTEKLKRNSSQSEFSQTTNTNLHPERL